MPGISAAGADAKEDTFNIFNLEAYPTMEKFTNGLMSKSFVEIVVPTKSVVTGVLELLQELQGLGLTS